MYDDLSPTVRWADLLPAEFHSRLAELPLVYLPLGLCEPHGHAAAFGLDTHKADYLCDEAARRFGGIVAPTFGYQIHETGYHDPWLKEVVGEVNPRLGALPPDVVLRVFLYLLRTFANAGFRSVVAITGHHGNQPDLRLVAGHAMEAWPLAIAVRSDPELVHGRFPNDHAGRYELSQLLHVRPDLVDLTRLEHKATSPLGRFAQGDDAADASAAYGAVVMAAAIDAVGELVEDCRTRSASIGAAPFITFGDVEEVWERIDALRSTWATLQK